MADDETYPNERGILATTFWEALEKRLADPKFAELADKPEFGEAISDQTGELLEEVSGGVFDTMLAALPATVAENHKLRRDFEATVEPVWGKPLELLHAFHGICMEVGDSCNRRYRDRAYDEDDYSWQAIVRLHARSCLVMGEVLALLRSGYASGAHARWRTLHELAVVAFFLREHDDEIAHRYLAHDAVQAYKYALSHRTYAQRLGQNGPTDDELDEAKRQRDELVSKFGPEFKHDYGWAAPVLPGQGRTFSEIEAATKLDHMRPYYKMASHAIHPNARGLFFDLGLGEDENLLLAGPSTRGLADPGMGACIALYQTTIALLNERPDVDEVVTMLVLQRMVPLVEDALLEANDAHDAETDRRRAERADADESMPGIPSDSRPTRLHRLQAAVVSLGGAIRSRR